ncbi:MAG: hypothetical protein KDK74_00780 [Cephaloticoccus sp.]|nr:hypothetical protein [Cephaloticoccus sp.]
MNSLKLRWHAFNDRVPRSILILSRFALGIVIGWLFHYLLYRLSLPVEPFIYVAF